MEIMTPTSFRLPLLATIPVALLLVSSAFAGPLQQAEIHKIVNYVRVIDSQHGSVRPAAVKDVIAKDTAVRTGVQSRAELLFQDDTLTRLGAETYFSFKPGTRDMNLESGTMLLQVPKNLGGARIKAAAVTAAITGTTIMIENLPHKNVKVLVLEGSLRLSMNGRFGESVVLKPGKMVIVGANDRRMPQPVTVDIAKVVRTSALIDPDKFSAGTKTKVDALPSLGLIQKEISIQSVAKGKGQMAETNLLIQGNGSKVVMATKETIAALNDPTGGSGSKAASASDMFASAQTDSQSGNGSTAATGTGTAAASTTTSVASATDTTASGSSGTSGSAGGSSGSSGGSSGSSGGSSGSSGGTSGLSGGTSGGSGLSNIISALTNAANNSGTGNTKSSATTTPNKTSGTNGNNNGNNNNVNSGNGNNTTATTPPPSNSVTAVSFSATQSITVTSGFLDIGLGGLTTGGYALSGYDYITVLGNADVATISVNGAFTVGGLLTGAAANGQVSLSANSIAIGGGINLDGMNGGGSLSITASDVLVDPAGINGISVNGADATAANQPGSKGGTVTIDTTTSTGTGAVTVNAPISATTGLNGSARTQGGGNGGTVSISAKDTITVNSIVKVSDNAGARVSKKGGNISLTSQKTTGTAIEVTNSGQLLSLLNTALPGQSGGTITFSSAGGDIRVTGGTIAADGGTVDIRNNGANGYVHVNNASIRGDTVKIGALGAGGQLLIGGGSISADTSLKLYAGSSTGQVRFTDNVTLGGNGAKIIAGLAVTIDPSKVVTIGGTAPATVYTTIPNYSGSGGINPFNGTFGGQGATTKPFIQKPAF